MNELIIFCAKYLLFVSALCVGIMIIKNGITRRGIKNLIIIFGSAIAAWVVAHILKDTIAHPRPDLTLALITPNDVYSFPSGHATFMFALAASYACLAGNTRITKLLFTFAVVTGIARVLVGVHFWYDIFGGAILGITVACGIFFLLKKFFKIPY